MDPSLTGSPIRSGTGVEDDRRREVLAGFRGGGGSYLSDILRRSWVFLRMASARNLGMT